VTGAVTSPLQRLARALLDLAFRFRVPLTWVVAIGGLLLARPTTASIVVGAAWALIGLGWRAWAAGTIRKNAELAVDGPYALSRHPLYFGNFMLATGFAAASGRLVVLAAIVALTLAVYIPLIQQEEAALLVLFGQRYNDYVRAVGRLVPNQRRVGRGGARLRFSWRQYLANHEYNAAIGYCAAIAALAALRVFQRH
jgi:protein-S-isoprenylcysteine O-methyltransferase Ste14